MRFVLERLITKVKSLDLVPNTSTKPFSSSMVASVPRKRTPNNIIFILLYDTMVINNSVPMGVDLLQYMFIHQPKHNIFYIDESQHMCFQCSIDLAKAPTEHLVHLRIECMGHIELEKNLHFLISLEVNKRRKELEICDYFQVNPKV